MTSEQGELAAARQRIKELETELALVTQAAKLFEEGVRPKAKYPVIAELTGQGFSARQCCRILGVAELVYGRGVIVNPKPVRKIMRRNGPHGLPGSRKLFRSKANIATTADLVERRFTGQHRISCG